MICVECKMCKSLQRNGYHAFGIIETHCIELQLLGQYAQVLQSGTGRVQGASIVTWKQSSQATYQELSSHVPVVILSLPNSWSVNKSLPTKNQDGKGIKQALAFNLHKRLAIDRRISYSIQQSSNI